MTLFFSPFKLGEYGVAIESECMSGPNILVELARRAR